MNCKWGKGHDILKCEMGKKKEGEEDPPSGKVRQARLDLMCEVGRGCSYREAYGGNGRAHSAHLTSSILLYRWHTAWSKQHQSSVSRQMIHDIDGDTSHQSVITAYSPTQTCMWFSFTFTVKSYMKALMQRDTFFHCTWVCVGVCVAIIASTAMGFGILINIATIRNQGSSRDGSYVNKHSVHKVQCAPTQNKRTHLHLHAYLLSDVSWLSLKCHKEITLSTRLLVTKRPNGQYTQRPIKEAKQTLTSWQCWHLNALLLWLIIRN